MTTGAVIFWAITFTILIVLQIKVMINDKEAQASFKFESLVR